MASDAQTAQTDGHEQCFCYSAALRIFGDTPDLQRVSSSLGLTPACPRCGQTLSQCEAIPDLRVIADEMQTRHRRSQSAETD